MQYAQLVIVMENRKIAEQNEAFSVKLYNLLQKFQTTCWSSLKTLLVSLNHNNWRSNIEQVFENPPGASFSGPRGAYSFVSLGKRDKLSAKSKLCSNPSVISFWSSWTVFMSTGKYNYFTSFFWSFEIDIACFVHKCVNDNNKKKIPMICLTWCPVWCSLQSSPIQRFRAHESCHIKVFQFNFLTSV